MEKMSCKVLEYVFSVIDKLYVPKGFFTPPFDTVASLYQRLSILYEDVELKTVESMACFRCVKGE